MFRVHYFFFILLSFCTLSQSYGQTVELKGKVLSVSDSLPLLGATVYIKGTSFGSLTNIDGEFSIRATGVNAESELMVTYLGYESKTLQIGNKRKFTIYLIPDEEQLDEVIITTSYGTVKPKEEVVGSITQLDSREINTNQSFESVDRMIEGLAPGVQVVSNTQVGTATQINIRGQGTFTPLTGNVLNASSQPLIIVDGVILSEESGFDDNLFDGGGRFGEQFLNPLSKIPPENIESISILKDAAAVSIYGADGANGVILITTKSGRTSKMQVNVSQQMGVSNPINEIEYLSGPQYHNLLVEYYQNNGESLESAIAQAGSATTNTDWFDLMNESGFFSRTQLNIAQKKGKFNYRASASYLLNDEVQVGNDFQTIRGSFNIGFEHKKFSASLRLSPSLAKKSNPNQLFSFPLPPNISPFDEDGGFTIIETGVIGNPLAVLNQNQSEAETIGLLTSLNLSYNINDNWSARFIGGLDYTDKVQNRYFSGENSSGQLSGNFEVDGVTYPNWGRKVRFDRNVQNYTFNATVSYQNTFNEKHNLDGLIGSEINEETNENLRTLGSGFIIQSQDNSFADAADVQINGYTSESARRSLFTQVNYDFDKTYFLTGSLRRDESSAFGGDVNAAVNGALGASWVISKADFMQKFEDLNFLRFRISYGSSGNSRIGSYRAQGLYTVDLTGFDGYNTGSYAFPVTAPNPLLSWEQNIKFNTGVDIRLFDSRLELTAEYYRDEITDIISSTNVVPESGFTTVISNVGSMENKGIEIALNALLIDKPEFSWRFRANYSQNRNKVLSVENLSSEFSSAERAAALRVGASTSAIWGVEWAGIDPSTGRNLYRNNGQIYDGASYRENFDNVDWEIIGDRLPDFFGSFQHIFQIGKNLNVTARFLYTYGQDFLLDRSLEVTDQLLTTRNMIAETADVWRQPGDIARNSRLGANQPIIRNSTKYLYELSFIKFQNLSINYTIQAEFLKKISIDKFSIFANADNLGYWYKNSGPGNDVGELRFTYPEMQTITLGFNLGF
jgi:TonB-linked SusC/RagA family outer membrane protein